MNDPLFPSVNHRCQSFSGIKKRVWLLGMLLLALFPPTFSQSDTLLIPQLTEAPEIDGKLEEWKAVAFHDGLWDIHRLRQSSWYEAHRNRLTDHGEDATPTEDLQARYYLAWDAEYLYFGAEVWDNVNDTLPSKPEPRRWYYKDGVSLFVEAPGDEINESFGAGDHGFSFVADPQKPKNGAWWRHGTPDTTYLEEPLPAAAVDYEIRLNPWGRSPGDYVLEARIKLSETLATGDPAWTPPEVGHVYRLMLVHCDPDGGGYGGHLLIYGKGDEDESWTPARLVGPIEAVERKTR
jgi:hypothetical protein